MSSWSKMKRIVAWLLKYKGILMMKARRNKDQTEDLALDGNIPKEAETQIMKMLQTERFPDDIQVLVGDNSSNKKKS